MTDLPKIAAPTPFAVEVQAGKPLFWCACGLSAKQPFCDGSHKGTTFAPVRHVPEADGKLWFCGCKHSARAPLCDGSHKRLEGTA
jgi:CDGSH iron-sulfur domain-containing protein 3